MQRHTVLVISAAILVVATAVRADQTDGPDTRPTLPAPDVLVILTDQWNPRCLGYAGDPNVSTPNLDQLAAEGMVFGNCYTPCPVCMPARCGLMSGLYPHNLGLFGNTGEYCLPPRQGRMFQDIRAAGYTTAQIGKLHWTGGQPARRQFGSLEAYYEALALDHCEDLPSPASTPSGSGPYQDHLRKIGRLDAYLRDMANRWDVGSYVPSPSAVEPEDHNDAFIASAAIDFLKRQPHDKPYCLVVSFPGPHPPLDAPGRYATMFAPENIELPPDVPEKTSYEGTEFDRRKLKEARSNYYGKLALIDDNVGRIVDALKTRGTWNNTLVVFTSDHGEMMGAHGHFSKGRFYEESARVPLVLRWPGHIEPRSRSDALVQMFDVYPTLVESIGGEVSEGHFARSLLPIALGKTDSIRDAVFSEIANPPHNNYMVRTKRFVWWIHRGHEALYDMRNDRFQMTNLIDSADHRAVLEEIRDRHLQYFMETQFDYAIKGVPKKVRMRELGGGQSENLSDNLYEIFRKKQGLSSDTTKP